MALPFLICATLTTVFVSQQAGDAADATDAARSVTVAGRLQALQADLQSELIPSMALTITKVPALRQIVGLGSLSASDVGLSNGLIERLRARTDADVTRLDASPGESATVSRTRAALSTIRTDIDSGLLLPQGFFKAIDLSNQLAADSTAVLRQGRPTNASAAIESTVRDATLVGAAVRGGASELAYLAAYKFPGLGASMTTTRARALWLGAWASFNAASQNVVFKASAATARRWRAALATPAVARYTTELGSYATDPARPLDVVGVLMLMRGNNARSVVLARVAATTSRHAVTVAERARARATRTALIVGGVVAFGLLLSMLIAVVVRRRIARPLQALSQQAESVSRGELVDVTSDGPREIRTVGHGLSAAVASLRRIESQAAAVSRGELDSDIVRDPLPGPLGEVMHNSVTTIIDAIHERDLAQSDLAYQATHDSLTGLPNRHQALMSIGHALQRARRHGDLTGLLFIDLDLFKVVNDNLGHAAGDEVLRVCAQRMTEIVRQTDVVYRLGGDEFVVLLEDVSRDFPFVSLAERMIAGISAPIQLGDATAQIGASIGISLCQDASVDAERLLSEADAATYSAKASGRGRVGVYDQALRSALNHRADTEHALARALDHDELVLHYQPVVEMGSSRPIGYEALIRWQHPELGLVPPSEFIPVAEKSTLINRIGRWSLYEATAQLARWDADSSHPADLSVAVNISGRHLVTTELVDDVRDALERSGVDARRLVVEITETVLVDDPIALDNMQRLRDLGVVVAIDDFGTGYTSIGQLPKLPVDVLKIDRSFTGSDLPGHHELVRLIVGAAHAFGLTVVAEGVEEADQADSLKALEVDTGQGFFYARPQPAAMAGELASLARLPRGSDRDAHRDPTALA